MVDSKYDSFESHVSCAVIFATEKIEDMVEQAVGDVEFGHFGKRDFAVVAEEEGDDVRVRVEAGAFLREVVGDNDVRAFAGASSQGKH